MGNNPINWIDPWGLWSSGVEAYTPYGGSGISFGQNPNGNWFEGQLGDVDAFSAKLLTKDSCGIK